MNTISYGLLLSALLGTGLLCTGGCNLHQTNRAASTTPVSQSKSTATPKSAPMATDVDRMDVESATDFTIVTGDGGGLSGYDVLKIDANGNCQYTFETRALPNQTGWVCKRAIFAIAPETVASIRLALIKNRILYLKEIYSAGVADGTQRFIKIRASGQTKTVFCDNSFPPEVTSIFNLIKSDVLATNSTKIAQAPDVRLAIKDLESPFAKP